MDKLSTKEQENIRKMSDVRLVSSLTKAGVGQDEIDAMDRTAMLNKWAELVATGADKAPAAAAAAAPVVYDIEVERERGWRLKSLK